MKTITTIEQTRKQINQARNENKTIGFVPTMGKLHAGHLSLIKLAKQEADFVVVSIFVNPLQFGPNEDFEKYPRDFDADSLLLEAEGVDLIYYPESEDMYPEGFSTYVNEDVLSKKLCGKSRPEHFKGVTTIVTKLFNIVQPDTSFFGQKDFQQVAIIKKMVKDLNIPIKITVGKTIREESGLAMSSRNAYLSPEEKQQASYIYESLKEAKKTVLYGEKNTTDLKKMIETKIITHIPQAKIDYIEILTEEKVIAVAVYLGAVRLIDNVTI